MFKKLFSKIKPWREFKLISEDGQTIYTVREKDGQERQLLQRLKMIWIPESKCKFSSLPCFEDYHRQRYLKSKLWIQGAV